MLKKFYHLAKPGIVYGNTLTTLAGFLFASRWHLDPKLLLASLFGIAFVIASACVFNNYIDRDIDKKMERTKGRELATGSIPVRYALVYASVLGLLGAFLLYAYVNVLTFGIALFGFASYTVLYGIAKRRSHWGAVVGSVPGAVPIVVGYTAVAGRLDAPAAILFLILVFWQMPHFYAIAIYRQVEYARAGIPALPVKKGVCATKIHIACYILAYIAAVSALAVFGYAGYLYLVFVLLFGLAWLWLAARGFSAPDTNRWARTVFFFSLVVLLAFSATLSLAPLVP